MKNFHNKSPDEIKELLNDAYMNIDVNSKFLANPIQWPPTYNKQPHLWITQVMADPNYFSFICKYVLNIDLLPFQALTLREMWNSRFPMLIMSRGGGKSFLLSVYCVLRSLLLPGRRIVIAGAAFRQSKVVFSYIENIYDNAPLLRDIYQKAKKDVLRHEPDMYRLVGQNGGYVAAIPIGPGGDKVRGLRANDLLSDEFNCIRKDSVVQTDKGLIKIQDYLNGEAYTLLNREGEWDTPERICITPKPVDVYEIKTRNGFSFYCSEKHQVMTHNGWKIAKDLTKNDYLPIDSNDYFPEKYVEIDGFKVNEEIGYLLGLLISEGSVENRYNIKIHNTDFELIDQIKKRFNYKWTETNKPAYVDKRGFDCKASKSLIYSNVDFRNNLKSIGLDYTIHKDKTIPWSILQSPRSVVLEFIKGLFAGDGSGFNIESINSAGLAYYSRSHELCRLLQILMLKFGIYGALSRGKRSKLSNHKQSTLAFRGESAYLLYKLIAEAKWGELDFNMNFQQTKPTIRVKGNRFISSTWYAGKNKYLGSFGSVKEAEQAFYDFWKEKRKLFKIKSVKKLSKKEVLYDFHLPKDNSYIANGFIQHNSIPRDIFETVLVGFTSVSSNPVRNVKEIAKDKLAKKLGIILDDYDDKGNKLSMPNQLVVTGTAGYTFQHFYEYWQDWHDIICSQGDKKKLERYLAKKKQESEESEENIVKNLNWKDYSIIRIPFELIPEGFMDQAQVARARATMHTGNYQTEYSACLTSKDEEILTQKGYKKYTDIKIGDLVLTHTGNWRPVTKKTRRKYSGLVYDIYSDGLNQPMSFTCDHPVWESENFRTLCDLDQHLFLPKLKDKKNISGDFGLYNNLTFTDNFLPIPFKKQKRLYTGQVYNLEVDIDESYVLRGGCVHNCFPSDSNGFFKRSLIESCTVGPDKIKKNGQEILFYSTLYGDRSKRYVFGIDPASEVDNFAIVVLELLDDHARVVYCWTTNKRQHKEEIKNKFVEDHDYYMYCARKIRQLMQRFPPAQICIDSEGGGRTIEQIFQDKTRWGDDEPLILPLIDRDKPQDTDLKDGLHILEVCKFANAHWLAEANNTLRLSMETKTLLFPHFDALVLAQSEGQDITYGNEYDKLEYVVTEIEELKNELCTIVQTRTTNGRDRWDTPEVRVPGGKKGRMRKDRYSALIMANLAAHNLRLDTGFVVPHTIGGYAGHFDKQEGPLFWGNSEYANKLSQIYEHL